MLIADLVSDLHRQGLRHFLIISGHASGLQVSCLAEVGEELLIKYPDIRVAVLSILDLASAAWNDLIVTKDDSHAGEVETSVMLHLRPHWVGEARPCERPQFPKHLLVRDKMRYWPGGVWGDASQASKEKGKKLFDLSVDALIQLIQTLDSYSA
jgi:creatinine amidohydrolase